MTYTSLFARAAKLLQNADSLIIGAGAGMGVDSGLPDFRGNTGFWNAYPALSRARIRFAEIANPQAFRTHARLAWGFYGHRLRLYRETQPNPAFALLARIAETLPHGAFVFTSNVDGQFQKAGFDPAQIWECHGSIHHLQCTICCQDKIWPADNLLPEIDEDRCQLLGDLPTCPHCGRLARPNILMFDDMRWNHQRSHLQKENFRQWRVGVQRPVIIEIGAGTSIPTVRIFCEEQKAPLIRINPRDDQLHGHEGVSLPLGGAAALQGIAEALVERGLLTPIQPKENGGA